MSEKSTQTGRSTFTTTQHAVYGLIGFIIWLIGVGLVRILGPGFFEPGSFLLLLMFATSIPFGFVIQYIIPPLIRLPLRETLIPITVMCGTALICDGIAIAFTNVYSADTTIKMTVGGWLLWTFGLQLVITLVLVGRAHNA